MKLFLSIILLVGAGLYFSSCTSKTQADDNTETDSDLESSINEVLELDTYLAQIESEKRPHHFVDVRTPEEVADGTIEGAINIDYNAADFIEQFSALDKNQPVYLFCRSGNRSGKATKLLIKAGYNEIYDLKGGYLAYGNNK